MDGIKIFRRRYLPDETIELKDDEILAISEDFIVTKWNVLKPREDITRGYSAYLLNQGIKVSKIYDSSDRLVYWYCDIVRPDIDKHAGTYIFHDLLIDVLIYPNGEVRVIDLDEFADIMEQGILDNTAYLEALRSTDALLKKIYAGEFSQLTRYIDELEKEA